MAGDPRSLAGLPDLTPWGIPDPVRVERPVGGTNNAVWVLDRSLVLRRYESVDATRVAVEHRLVAALRERGDLPFDVPAPIPALDGRTVVEDADGRPLATFPFIPGRPARGASPHDIERVAEALGLLDRALAQLPAELAPRDGRLALDRLHPAVGDLAELADELERVLPADPGVDWLRAAAGPAEREYARLCAELPAQIVHGDLSPANVIIAGERVSGVLDFDHAYWGLRVEDPVAAALMAASPGTPGIDRRLAAFRRGFARSGRLEAHEDDAIPALLRRRAVGSVVWRAGLWRSGRATLDDLRERLAEGLALEERLGAGAVRLTAH